MAREKVIFIAFAKEDERHRNLFVGQRLNVNSPFRFTDMSVKRAYSREWKTRTRSRIRRSDGVIVLVSRHTRQATGQLWEIECARKEGKPIRGIWVGGYRTRPRMMGSTPIRNWTWANVARFINSL
jgi:hypothetical protein